MFSSTKERGKPATFRVNQVIKGWQEALKLMKPGAQWRLFIPSDLAYGASRARTKIGPNSALVFDMKLLSFKKTEKKSARALSNKLNFKKPSTTKR